MDNTIPSTRPEPDKIPNIFSRSAGAKALMSWTASKLFRLTDPVSFRNQERKMCVRNCDGVAGGPGFQDQMQVDENMSKFMEERAKKNEGLDKHSPGPGTRAGIN
jgi:hypothetical protein